MAAISKEQWHVMTGKEKAEYVWEYYKYPIIIGAFILIMLVYWVVGLIGRKDHVVGVLMIDTTGNAVEVDFSDFLLQNGKNPNKEDVNLNDSLVFIDAPEEMMNNYNKSEMLVAWLMDDDYDIMFGTEANFADYLDQGACIDLREALPEDLYAEVEDQIVFNDPDDESSYPCAILLKDNAWLNKNGYYSGDCLVGLLGHSEHPEMGIAFLRYILDNQ